MAERKAVLAGCRREGSLGEKLQFKSPRAQISVVFDGFLAVFGVFGGVVSLRQGLSDKLLGGEQVDSPYTLHNKT